MGYALLIRKARVFIMIVITIIVIYGYWCCLQVNLKWRRQKQKKSRKKWDVFYLTAAISALAIFSKLTFKFQHFCEKSSFECVNHGKIFSIQSFNLKSMRWFPIFLELIQATTNARWKKIWRTKVIRRVKDSSTI